MPPVTRDSAKSPFALAVDVGSSSVRAMLFDRLGRDVEGLKSQIAYEPRTTPDGGVESDADALVELTARAIDGLLGAAGSLAGGIAVVGASCYWHSLVGVDAEGRAVTPVVTWADTRAADAAERLRRTLDEASVHRRTGAMLHPSYLPAKLVWLHEADRQQFERASHWMSFAEYLYLKLCGTAACSLSMASGTGLFDQNAQTWDEQMIDALPIVASQLSPISDEPVAGLTSAYAARWPALAALPWYPPLGDGACSNVGCGCITPERIAVMVGTSSAMRVVCENERIEPPQGLWTYRLDRRRFVVGGALSEGGGLFAWLVETLRVEPGPGLEDALGRYEPDAHGLTILPTIAGERSPGWASHARAAIVGLGLDTKPVDVVRAALEAVAYRLKLVSERLPVFVAEEAEVIASGGALLHSPVWVQIMADVLGRSVRLSGEEEASSRGAALEALDAIGAIEGLQAAPAEMGRLFEPDASRHERYLDAIERQRVLYQKLITKG